ncbi:hypothetical protein MRBBS_3246 [Marinobacter sp. BSs20148]|nr:hypothetical protein MRBBS_3246 [Marinobacter sp. BSs20148]
MTVQLNAQCTKIEQTSIHHLHQAAPNIPFSRSWHAICKDPGRWF